jgi:predicted RNA methylase
MHTNSISGRKMITDNQIKIETDNLVLADNTYIMASESDIKIVDLFCGMGSFHYSFKKLGFKCVMASDIYKPAKLNYKENYGMDVLGDICDIDPSTIEPRLSHLYCSSFLEYLS